MQCWTFHKFTFFETLKRVEDLGIEYLEAYPGQPIGGDIPDVVFGPDLTEEQIKLVKRKLMEHGISLVNFGVVGFDNNEAAMRKIFDFAAKGG